ncbi:hypothetical protein AMJ52_04170 [candidate division TA06 bacterium DG_78]|uniref:FlgD/Vpr Ig-like domain-containing protein n=1 Tax=candidate division TA06 bacterium DG_78 TaxID=1703772 RepID=A0A0S7YGH1_UNCT6|nr:MAG: hypothetical protein AMJ52_04170 [candidate division TA06 bacterium DG_78]
MNGKLKGGLFILFILLCPLLAQYNFDFSNTTDTIVVDSMDMFFHFELKNTGSLPDSYEIDCQIIDSVPNWTVILCAGGFCGPPSIRYVYLDVGEVDTTISIDVFITPDSGMEVINLHVQSVFEPSLMDSITVFAVYGTPGQYSFDFTCLSDTVIADTGMVEFHFSIENTGTSSDTYAFDLRIVDSIPGWDESFYVDGVWADPGTILTEYLGVWAVDSAIYVRVDPAGDGTEILNLHVSSTANPGLRDSITMYVIFQDPGVEEYIHGVDYKTMLRIYPNPFKYKTDINYSIGHDAQSIELKIYDVSGQLVKEFPSFTPNALHPTLVTWDGKDDFGRKLPQGVYIVRLICQDLILTDKTILLR